MFMRIAVIALGAVVCAGAYAAVTKASIFGGEPKNNVVNVRTGDANIAKARSDAQATLDGFLQRARSPMPSQGNFAVKVGLGGVSGPKEFVWITRFKLDGDVGSGTLDNVPVHLPELKAGQTVTFRRADVSDWMYKDGKSLKGNFTGCAILAAAPDAAERNKQFLKVGLDCSQSRV
jgi:uncharacterized protein YegJ (DUF2314 family)